MTNCFNGARDKIKGFASQAVGWGKDFANGLAKGIKDAASKVIDAAKGLGNKIKEFLHFSRPDKGPLRDYETWMPDFVQGMANGINANKHILIGAVQRMSNEMAMPAMSLVPAMNAPVLQNVGANRQVATDDAGESKLYDLINKLASNLQNAGDITIPIYLGTELIDEQIIRADDRRTVRSGGRA